MKNYLRARLFATPFTKSLIAFVLGSANTEPSAWHLAYSKQ